MRNKIKKYIKEIALFFIVMTIFANVISLYRSLDLSKEPLSIKHLSLLNNVNYDISYEKPVLVHFWATWCPTCKAEASNIQTISQNYDVLTIAVKSGSDEEIHKYLKSHDLTFNTVNDNEGYLANKFNVSVFPTTIIYNKSGDILFSDVGYTSTWGLWLKMWWASY